MTRATMRSIMIFLLSISSIVIAGESRLELSTHFSPVLGINKDYYIYLPEGYDENSDEFYPVVYFFRGHESEWTDLNEDHARNNRNIKTLADQLYSEDKIGRMILVMPGTMIHEGGLNTYGINLNYPQFVNRNEGLGTGQYEDYFIEDLITHIDSTYRTVAKGTHRGTDGFSAGGWPAVMSATKYPDLFSSVGAYDGVITEWLDLNNLWIPGILDASILVYSGNDPWYGPLPRDPEEIMSDSPANLIYDADDYNMSHLYRMQFLLHTVVESNDIGIRWMTPYIDYILGLRGMDNYFNPQELSPFAAHNWYHADEHTLVTLPLHWQKFQNTVNIIHINIAEPSDGQEIAGEYLFKWSPGVPLQTGRTEIYFSVDGGDTEQLLTTIDSADSSYLWPTSELPDGTKYKLRVLTRGTQESQGDSVLGYARTTGEFTINNPGNAIPEIEINTPHEAEEISGNFEISWEAEDADGDSLSYSIEYSPDDGKNWHLLEDEITQLVFNWKSNEYENSSQFRLAVHAGDSQVQGSDTSDMFTVYNPRIPAEDQRIAQLAGYGTPEIQLLIIDPDDLIPDAFYQITFDDTTYAQKVFTVINDVTGDTLIKAGDQLDGLRESNLFDGVRLLIKDYPQPEINDELTEWKNSVTNLKMNVHLPSVDINGTIHEGVPYPADYLITITEQVSDTTTFAFEIPSKPVRFTVYNLTEKRNADFIFQDRNNNQTIDDIDILYLMEKKGQDDFYLVWAITFAGPGTPISPLAGDEAMLSIFKPVTGEDIFEFEVVNSLMKTKDNLPVTSRLHQNYPNPFNPITVIGYKLSAIGNVELKVFNILGQEVVTLVSERQQPGPYQVEWNAGDYSSGIYYYQIKAGNYHEVKKMILLK